MKLLLPDGELAIVTRRCLQDYIDQVRPACATDQEAWKDLQRLIGEHGTLTLSRPEWMAPRAVDAEEWSGVPRWIAAGDVAVLVHYAPSSPDVLLATAVVTRGSVGSEVRRIKSERGAAKREYRRLSRKEKSKARSKRRRERRDQLERESDSRRDAP